MRGAMRLCLTLRPIFTFNKITLKIGAAAPRASRAGARQRLASQALLLKRREEAGKLAHTLCSVPPGRAQREPRGYAGLTRHASASCQANKTARTLSVRQ